MGLQMTGPARHWFLLFLLLLSISGATVHFAFGYSHRDLSGHAWGTDDAYITYRYAQNLVGGHGLVYNPNERVEGYSNFLMVLLSAAFLLLYPNGIYTACFVFSTACFVVMVLIFYFYLGRKVNMRLAQFGALTLCLCPVMWIWPGSGLETSAVLLAQVALFTTVEYMVIRDSAKSTALFCFLTLCLILLRADGFVFPLLCTVVFLLKRQYRYWVRSLAFVVVSAGLFVVCRYFYYGDVLPNSYYVKVSGGLLQRIPEATLTLARSCRDDAFFLYLVPLAFCWYTSCREQFRRRVLSREVSTSISVVSFGLLAYWMYIGGDTFEERFLLVLIPLSILSLITLDMGVLLSKRRLNIILIVMVLQFLPFVRDLRFDYHLHKYDRWVELGRFLAQEHPDATLAIDAAGKVPFCSRLYTIDMLGLNDKYIGHKPASFFKAGHNKYDADYVLNRHPDLISAWGKGDLDLSWGMSRDRYKRAGYVLKYAVNTSAEKKAKNIVDVSGMNEAEIGVLFCEGYEYFVITREVPKSKTEGMITQ